jgi:hydroxylamine dehydrogenase
MEAIKMLWPKRMSRIIVSSLGFATFAAGVSGTAYADIPNELYKALGISESASPKELYEALEKRYHDPKQGAGKGKYGDL